MVIAAADRIASQGLAVLSGVLALTSACDTPKTSRFDDRARFLKINRPEVEASLGVTPREMKDLGGSAVQLEKFARALARKLRPTGKQ